MQLRTMLCGSGPCRAARDHLAEHRTALRAAPRWLAARQERLVQSPTCHQAGQHDGVKPSPCQGLAASKATSDIVSWSTFWAQSPRPAGESSYESGRPVRWGCCVKGWPKLSWMLMPAVVGWGGSDPLPDPIKEGHLCGRVVQMQGRWRQRQCLVSVPLGLAVTSLLERGFTVPLCVQPGSAQLCGRRLLQRWLGAGRLHARCRGGPGEHTPLLPRLVPSCIFWADVFQQGQTELLLD